MMDLESFRDAEMLKDASCCGVRQLRYLLHVLDERIDQAKPVFEERRQLAYADVAVLVDRRRQHCAAVFAVPVGVVGAASKERDAERCAADDHSGVSYSRYEPLWATIGKRSVQLL